MAIVRVTFHYIIIETFTQAFFQGFNNSIHVLTNGGLSSV